MFVDNFYKLFRAMFTTMSTEASVKLVDYNGKSFNPYKTNSSSYIPFSDNFFYVEGAPQASITTSAAGLKYPSVVFGTGTTPATLSDYKLESTITSGISASASGSASNTEDTGTLTFVYTVNNTSSESITIGEIGYRASVPDRSGHVYNVLIDRTVLDTPVTIPAGSSGTLVYVIEYGLPVPPA